jgi:transposase
MDLGAEVGYAATMTQEPDSVESCAPPDQVAPLAGLPGACVPDAGALSLAQCLQIIAVQAGEIAQLREQMALLQERLKLDSKNSSKPPSSDGPGSGNRAQRRASQRARGAQKGHKGAARAMLDEREVDQIIDCAPPEVCRCGAPVVGDGQAVRHQVFDVPPVRAVVNEYRLHAGCCMGCGKKHRGALPAGVPTGQIGPRALALIGALGTRYHLTQFKIRDLLAQVTGVDFSVGAISQAHGKLAQALATPVSEAIKSLATAPILHMDETRYPREGISGNWVWGVVSPTLAVYSLLPSRARYVITSLIGEKPQGIVVSDRYAGYAHIPAEQRQVCWSHLIRDFIRISERAGLAGRIGANLLGSAYVLFRWRTAAKSAAQFEPLQRRVERALRRGRDQTACRRTAATCANLLRSLPSLWTFLRDPRVEPTNNDAERALRGIVIKRKISGPTRSRRGDEFIARAFTAQETCRRQGRDLWEFLHQAVTAWIDKTAPPSLLPASALPG